MHTRILSRAGAALLASLMLGPGLVAPPAASAAPPPQHEIELGSPTIWSFEQAHYLLAQMRKKNAELKVAEMTNGFDPNAANALTAEEFLSGAFASGTFNGVDALKNSVEIDRYKSALARSRALTAELDQRNDEKLEIQSRITEVSRRLEHARSELAKERAALPQGQSESPRTKELEADIARLTARLEDLENERLAIQGRIDSLATQAKAIEDALKTFTLQGTSPATPPATKGLIPDQTAASDLIANMIDRKEFGTAALPASIALQNYVDFQYELIAKQLTILRDEAGPGSRIVFLELPCSIYLDPKHAPGSLVEVRWNIDGYVYDACYDRFDKRCADLTEAQQEGRAMTTGTAEGTKSQGQQPLTRGVDRPTTKGSLGEFAEVTQQDRLTPEFQERLLASNVRLVKDVKPDLLRVVDLIPRQSALNVTDIHRISKGFGFAAKFMSVFGLGIEVDYQRRRDKYSEFLQQQVYASGFGKGTQRFGWTFGPVPGTESIAPGARTTYAVLAVPADALAVKLHGESVVYDRMSPKPRADTSLPSKSGEYVLWLADPTENGFVVDQIDYTQVKSGETATMILRGNFSAQIGVSVKGSALSREVALTQADWLQSNTFSGMGSNTNAAGRFEFANPNTLILQFTMDSDYEGTPIILLETPSKSGILNRYKVRLINYHEENQSLAEYSRSWPMFIKKLGITNVSVFKGPKGVPRIEIRGAGFRDDAAFTINSYPLEREGGQQGFLPPNVGALPIDALAEPAEGAPQGGNPPTEQPEHTADKASAIDSMPEGTTRRLLRIPNELLRESKWNVTVHQATKEGVETFTLPIDNPFLPKVRSYEILNFTPATGKKPAVIDLRLGLVNAPDNPKFSILDEEMGEIVGDAKELGEGDYYLRIHQRSDPVLMLVTSESAKVTSIVTIVPPMFPHIVSIKNGGDRGASGVAAGGYFVVIRGENLSRVTRVLFGTTPSANVSISAGALTVLVPPGAKGTVPIRLETDVVYRGNLITNVGDFALPSPPTFTYE
jgi:hypothetical protein